MPPAFAALTPTTPPGRRRAGLALSLAAHATILALLVVLPVLVREDLPEHRDYVRALLYAPPPPPPPPPPKGSSYAREAPRPAAPSPTPSRAALTMPAESVPAPAATRAPEAADQGLEVWGTPAGSEAGVPEGMEGGVEGGVVGGVPGGVLGGVIGGTGDIPVPVMDYDRPPRLIKQVKPAYPHEAFTKKVQGTVLLEILIGADGRVHQARVLRSVRLLDEAAVAAARQWTFAPALKHGVAVATVATAPVSFSIY